MEQEEQVKDWQGANGATPAIVFLAMSSFPSVVSIRFFLQLSAYLLILHRIIPPHYMPILGPPEMASPRVQGWPTRLQGCLKQLKVRGAFGRLAHAAVGGAPKSAPTILTNDVRALA